MCDKEFKELVKIAVEKLKDESVLKLLQADASYQKDSKDERYAEDAFNQLDLTEKQREVCQHLIDCREKQDFEYGTHAYIAGLMDAFHIMMVLFPEKWDTERIRKGNHILLVGVSVKKQQKRQAGKLPYRSGH